jgi:AAA family ATP:ADP antiporter
MFRRSWAPACAYGSILTAYSLLRPMRDAYALPWGAQNLRFGIDAIFALVAVCSLCWSALATHLRRRSVVAFGHHVLAASLVGFWIAFRTVGATKALGIAFFLWSATFNLMATSLFWSQMVDLHEENDGRRRFPFILAGGTVGAIVGPGSVVLLSPHIAPYHLLLVSAALIEMNSWFLWVARRSTPGDALPLARAEHERLGGDWIDGLARTLRSPRLRSLSLFVIAVGMLATFLYVEQARIVARELKDVSTRVHFFATVDLTVNVCAIVVQLIGTRAVLRRLGPAATLAALPLAGAVGVSALVTSPSQRMLFAAQLIRRVADYALAAPAREVVFTAGEVRDKYKAKGFVDVVAPRFGDALGAHVEALSSGSPARSFAFAWTLATFALLGVFGVRRARRRDAASLRLATDAQHAID